MSVPAWPSKNSNEFARPTPSGPGSGSSEEGRVARSRRLVRESWRYLNERPKLLALPALSAAAAVIAAIALFIPASHVIDGWPDRLQAVVVGAVFALPLTFVTVFCNVGFLSMVREHQAGREPSIRRGLAQATARLPVIVAWTVLTWTVGTLLATLQQLPFVGGVLGRILGFLGGLAWALATFFVVPVLVLEPVGALAAVRRSAQAFRARWGEAVTADVGIGAVFGILGLPGWFLFIFGITDSNLVLTAAGIAWIAPLIAVQSALTQLFTLQLYTEDARGPWSAESLRAAVKPRKRRWFSRRGREA